MAGNQGHNTVKKIFKNAKDYSAKAGKTWAPVCEILRKEISRIMPKGTGRIYYSMPAWLINDNPVVAYKASKKHVLLLFWSGQSFKTPGLHARGSFKAADIRYRSAADIDAARLRKWLRESKKIMWNYRDIRKNKGKMQKL
jgi:hypothetical protein